jgi:hypothetical protein
MELPLDLLLDLQFHPAFAFKELNQANSRRDHLFIQPVSVKLLLLSTIFIWLLSVALLLLPSQNCSFHGQHGHGGAIFTKFEKNAITEQSTVIKLSGLAICYHLTPQTSGSWLLCWASISMVSGMWKDLFLFVWWLVGCCFGPKWVLLILWGVHNDFVFDVWCNSRLFLWR